MPLEDKTSQIEDWKKLKIECDKAIKETDKDLKEVYKHNFWFGVKEYHGKYHVKFDYWNEPKEEK